MGLVVVRGWEGEGGDVQLGEEDVDCGAVEDGGDGDADCGWLAGCPNTPTPIQPFFPSFLPHNEYLLICIKNAPNPNGLSYSMILPPYPTICSTHPATMHAAYPHVLFIHPCTPCTSIRTPKTPSSTALATSDGRYWNTLSSMGQVRSVQFESGPKPMRGVPSGA